MDRDLPDNDDRILICKHDKWSNELSAGVERTRNDRNKSNDVILHGDICELCK